MTVDQIQRLIDKGEEHAFYCCGQWAEMRAAVLRLDRYECQRCKARGRYSPAVVVHHVKHLKDRPDLALSITDPDTGERQLVSLCKACHELEHPERLRQQGSERPAPLTSERWD